MQSNCGIYLCESLIFFWIWNGSLRKSRINSWYFGSRSFARSLSVFAYSGICSASYCSPLRIFALSIQKRIFVGGSVDGLLRPHSHHLNLYSDVRHRHFAGSIGVVDCGELLLAPIMIRVCSCSVSFVLSNVALCRNWTLFSDLNQCRIWPLSFRRRPLTKTSRNKCKFSSDIKTPKCIGFLCCSFVYCFVCACIKKKVEGIRVQPMVEKATPQIE